MTVIINGKEESAKLLEDLLDTLKSLEKTIKTLNEKNSFLSKVVVILACFALIASSLQIYFIICPPSKTVNHSRQEISMQKSEPELNSNSSKTQATKAILVEPKNKNSSKPKTNKKEISEKELNLPSNPPK